MEVIASIPGVAAIITTGMKIFKYYKIVKRRKAEQPNPEEVKQAEPQLAGHLEESLTKIKAAHDRVLARVGLTLAESDGILTKMKLA